MVSSLLGIWNKKKPTDLVVQGGFCLFRVNFGWGSFLLHRHLQALCELDSVALVLSQKKFPRRSTGELLVLLSGLMPVLCPLIHQQMWAWEIQCLQLKMALSLSLSDSKCLRKRGQCLCWEWVRCHVQKISLHFCSCLYMSNKFSFHFISTLGGNRDHTHGIQAFYHYPAFPCIPYLFWGRVSLSYPGWSQLMIFWGLDFNA